MHSPTCLIAGRNYSDCLHCSSEVQISQNIVNKIFDIIFSHIVIFAETLA